MFKAGLAVAVLAAACCWSQEANAEADGELLIKEVSFEAPFESFDVSGTRNVPGYRHGGNADIKKNFVRLTAAREVRQLSAAGQCEAVHFVCGFTAPRRILVE